MSPTRNIPPRSASTVARSMCPNTGRRARYPSLTCPRGDRYRPRASSRCRPLLIPSETEAPLLQASFDDAICTFQSPSKVDAAADVAVNSAASRTRRVVEIDLRKYPMTGPCVLIGARSHIASGSTVMTITWASQKPPPGRRGLSRRSSQRTTAQLTRVQVWPPQNTPPKAQPWTRKVSEPFSAIVES